MKQAFSLIELMVVVAIIGILATLAIPNYQKFSARSRQTSAKSELAGIFTVEKSFQGTYSTYGDNLPLMGYLPDGVSVVGGGSKTVPLAKRYYVTGVAVSVSGFTAPCDNSWPQGDLPWSSYNGGTPIGVFISSNEPGNLTAWRAFVTGGGGGYSASAICDVKTFVATAAGDVRGKGTYDIWTINQDRVLKNDQSGL